MVFIKYERECSVQKYFKYYTSRVMEDHISLNVLIHFP